MFEKCILESEFWELLGYKIDSYNHGNLISYEISCKRTERIVELMDTESIGFFTRLELTFNFVSEESIQIMDLLVLFNYLTCSLILHLERAYPLVFSYYGRLFFCLNFEHFKQNLSLIQQSPIYEPIPNDIYLHNLIQLIKLSKDFNSISIMRNNQTSAKVSKLKKHGISSPTETFENLHQLLHCLTLIDPSFFESLIP